MRRGPCVGVDGARPDFGFGFGFGSGSGFGFGGYHQTALAPAPSGVVLVEVRTVT
jgi:hypothetical protein